MITDGYEIERRARLMHVGAQVWAEAASTGIDAAADTPYVAGPEGERDRSLLTADAAMDRLVRNAAATKLTVEDLAEFRRYERESTYLAGQDSRRNHEWAPDFAIPPGRTLHECLCEFGLTQTAFAQAIGRPIQVINEIISGKKAITPQTALQLEEAFGISADMWVRLEAQYRLALARAARRHPTRRRNR